MSLRQKKILKEKVWALSLFVTLRNFLKDNLKKTLNSKEPTSLSASPRTSNHTASLLSKALVPCLTSSRSSDKMVVILPTKKFFSVLRKEKLKKTKKNMRKMKII